MSSADVQRVASELVAAFAAGRVDDYFACFAPEATFIFHTTSERLESRNAYRQLWSRWEVQDGFRVLGCTSTNARVAMAGEHVGVFVHDVQTDVRTKAGDERLNERETIVFERRDGRWLAIHEHLSPAP